MRARARSARLAGAVAAAWALAQAPLAGQQPPAVQLETRADVILVDASVLDDRGMPIADLTRDDFTLTIDGVAREIASVQFVRHEAPARAAAPQPSHYSTNAGASAGRRIMIAVDENSIPPGGARAALRSIERLVKSFAADDRVGFVRLPHFAGSIEFTTDHARALEAVKKTVGQARRVGLGRVTLSEAVAYDRGDTQAWDRALTRICSAAAPARGISARPGTSTGVSFDAADEEELCRQAAANDAVDRVATYRQRARETVDGLGQLLSNLRAVPGAKTLVLLSQGFLSHDLRLEMTRLAEGAAAARVSLYAIHIDAQGMELDAVESSFTRAEDERLMAEGIDHLAGASRGARFRIVGSGEGIFTRVARELSGYYLLGVEPTDADRDGKPHRIAVAVKRPDTTVRARSQFIIGAATAVDAAAGPPAEALLELLRAASPEPGVPLRLAAFSAPAPPGDRVRIIVGADIGPPVASPIELHLGMLVVDGNGDIVGNQLGTVTLRPDAADGVAVPRYVGSLEVPPGSYTLRFAAIDATGRGGSVHHPLDARVRHAGGLRVSDLMLTVPRPGRTAVRPEIHLELAEPALQPVLELAASDRQALDRAQVTFEVSDGIDGKPLLGARGFVRPIEGTGGASATGVIDVGVLPPGEYVARARVEVPGETSLVAVRPFHIAPRAPRQAADAAGASIAAAAVATAGAAAASRMRLPIPPFRVDDVLAPDVVNPFIDHVLERYSPSPAAREALTAIRGGNLQQAARGTRQVGDAGLSFAQGLSLLAANRTAEADAYFRAALRSASDFLGAAFYLGATLAAAGKDRDAVAAWQTALIGDVGATGVYPVLIDGLLRLREGEQALEFLEEAEPTFTDRTAYQRRLVQAHALLARYDQALPLAHECLARKPGDVDLLFLTMHMIYEAQASNTLANPAVELERFRQYAAAYEAAQGPHTLVVQGWRKALGIR